MNVDQAITNHRLGACLCGRRGKIIYGPSPFGYGNTCKSCRKAWSRKHHRPWRSNAEKLAIDRALRRGIPLVTSYLPHGLPTSPSPPKP